MLIPSFACTLLDTIGMVAWLINFATPEYPAGRKMILIANDVTIQAGSFGPVEDRFFAAASKLARQLGIPRIYISANSGARIGLATEPMDLFRAKFVNDDPTKGLEYLYLDEDGYKALKARAPSSVLTDEIMTPDGETHYVITDIIGQTQNGLGVECLSGSGLIAGETSRARDEIFTATLVTGRSVGIGAYLARLGERVVQVEGSPLILTGYQALNKLLGREVYTSNLQLGGPQIMYRNGVSHLTAPNDLEAMRSIVRWLAFVPAQKGGPVPILQSADSWDRTVDYNPPKGPYDPRWLLEGKEEAGSWLSGFFDKGSWQETLAGWATSVVVGRARLGGIPMGVIAVETRTLERVVPADPANPNSVEQRILEAGQVWYPNSSYKTAQAIFDFNREGLPLIIFANWRGFSGGQQDMFDEILKQGSKIVDGLSSYKQPVFVYIPPKGELRGGAFVVVDSTINDNGFMEMYADEESRGGVLEPEGIVEIKYRADKQRATMARLDKQYSQLLAQSKDATDLVAQAQARNALAAREKELAPAFHGIAVHYSDLHDRAGRMLEKGVIRKALSWSQARRFFYWRLRRRLNEEQVACSIAEANPELSRVETLSALNSLLCGSVDLEDDTAVAKFLEQHRTGPIAAGIDDIRKHRIANTLASLASQSKDGLIEGFARLLESADPEMRRQLAALVSK